MNWVESNGFCDADAGFFINKKTEFRVGKKPKGDGYYYKFVTKFYITQDGEVDFLKKVQFLFIIIISSTTKTKRVRQNII